MDSAERVESIDELLMEILIRLPGKSLFRFMCVSKRWKNIMTAEPFFLQSRRRLVSSSSAAASVGGGRLMAVIQTTFVPLYLHIRYPYKGPGPQMNILPVNDTPANNNRSIRYVPKSLGYFVNSSNGLILCGHHPSKYHVLNPVSKKWVSIPPPPRPPQRSDGYESRSIGLLCEENATELEASYMVVRAAARKEDNTIKIETYTSKTGKWVVKTLAADNYGLLYLSTPPVVANGAFHWLSASARVIGVYKPHEDEDHVQLIELPEAYDNYLVISHVIARSPADNTLWYGMITPHFLLFFMLLKESGGGYSSANIPCARWVLMHRVSIGLLREEAGGLPESPKMTLEYLIPWSPMVALLRQGPKVFLYNLESKSIQFLHFYGLRLDSADRLRLSPYLEPSFLSSYCL